jgi:hypothetical protein
LLPSGNGHQTKEDIPKKGIPIDATASVARVVDEIVRQREADVCEERGGQGRHLTPFSLSPRPWP